jgi:exopolysaccharide biosynthesis polyprenyl glycosylphosphotransferase
VTGQEDHPAARSLQDRRLSKQAQWMILRALLIVSDLILTFAAFQAAYAVRFSLGLSFFKDVVPSPPLYTAFMLLVIPIWVAVFAFMGLYDSRNLLGGTREYALLFNATSLGMIINISLGFLFPDELILSRGWVIAAWLTTFFMTGMGRFGLRRLIYSLRRSGYFQSPTLLVGMNQEGRLLYEQITTSQNSGLRMLGYVDVSELSADPDILNLKRLGSLANLDAIIQRQQIETIILTSSALSQEQVIDLFTKYGTLKNLQMRLSTGLYEIITTGVQVREDGMVPMMVINKVRMAGADQFFKSLLDYLITIPVLIILLPVFLVVAVAIKLDSTGPIIYRRRVVGVNGKEFDAFKFRTMIQDSDRYLAAHPELLTEYKENYKLKRDPRVTRLGQFLRKFSIDELPQLVNVLRNEMSIVGPRMITPQELEKYNQWGINLLTVKPGITGMWQVRGRSDVSYEERVRFDMFYIRNWTIWMDIQLIFQTIPAILSKRGAY